MRRLHAKPDQVAVIGTAVLGGVLLGQALDATSTAYAVVNGAAGVTAGLAALAMATRDSFDARLTAGVVCAVTGLVALLGIVVGPPGASDGDLSLAGATLLACGILVPVLLGIQHTSGLARDERPRPYAP